MQRWSKPEKNTRQQGDKQRKAKHAHIDADVVRSRNRLRTERDKQIGAPKRQKQTAHAPDERQQDTLRKELANYASALRAKGETHRHLMLASRRTRQQQIRNIRASDKEHANNRPEDHQQRCPHIADEFFQRRRQTHPLVCIVVRILLLETLSDYIQLGLSLRDSYARFYQTNHVQVLKSPLRNHWTVKRNRRPQLDQLGFDWKLKAGRHDADNREAAII